MEMRPEILVFGDVEGNKEIIRRIQQETNLTDGNVKIFLGDIVNNFGTEEFEESIHFLRWILTKNKIRIEHKNLSEMNYFQIWNGNGLNLKFKDDDQKHKTFSEILNIKLKRINFVIGNKEVRLYRLMRENKINLPEDSIKILETYFFHSVPFLIVPVRLAESSDQSSEKTEKTSEDSSKDLERTERDLSKDLEREIERSSETERLERSETEIVGSILFSHSYYLLDDFIEFSRSLGSSLKQFKMISQTLLKNEGFEIEAYRRFSQKIFNDPRNNIVKRMRTELFKRFGKDVAERFEIETSKRLMDNLFLDYLLDDWKKLKIVKIVSGHSKSLGNYVFRRIPLTTIDLTEYYAPTRERLIFKQFGIPKIMLSSKNDFSAESVQFFTEEFKLKDS